MKPRDVIASIVLMVMVIAMFDAGLRETAEIIAKVNNGDAAGAAWSAVVSISEYAAAMVFFAALKIVTGDVR